MNEIASRYGLALYSLALEENKISSLQEESKELIAILKDNNDFILLLGSEFLSLKERLDILEQSLIGVDKDIVSFLAIVIENNRSDYIIEILEAFNSYCYEYKGVLEGYIYSTLKLDQNTIQKISEKLSKIEHKQIELKNKIDPSLIGGVKVIIGDKVYDGSIKNHLEMMKNDLLK